jgi:hypothetical protein
VEHLSLHNLMGTRVQKQTAWAPWIKCDWSHTWQK